MGNDAGEVDGFIYRHELENYGRFLSARRKALGLSQEAMAGQVGCSQSSISRIETGAAQPKDREMAFAIAKGYELSLVETRDLLELVYPIATLGDVESEVQWQREQSLLRLNEILELLMGKGRSPETYSDHLYYRSRVKNVFRDQGPDFTLAIRMAIEWLLHERQWPLSNALILELTPLVIHHLNDQGHYRLRLHLADRAIRAASERGFSSIEGWLRSDAIPWTLMEQRQCLLLAYKHLNQGLELARAFGDKDMEATALALLAQNTTLRHIRTSEPHEHLNSAMKLDCSPSAKRRVYGAAGDLALAERRISDAYYYYNLAAQLDRQYGPSSVFTPSLWLRSTFLELESSNLLTARDKLLKALHSAQMFSVPIRIARIYFSLAILSQKESKFEDASRYAGEALKVLSTADNDLRLTNDLQSYTKSLFRHKGPIVTTTEHRGPPPT